ncbi:hypothetical protein E6O75_ATG05769 [Venturia nashicola]|uniref:amidase n=1 Tax=Venturia nashicola TaxID=86259 RepID=A0A4Z1PH88_9PEZI|nr:hypothetical protein E6O75_ATG05769 [Venturia nashicola]
MSTPTGSPRKSKRQKREQADLTRMENGEILPGQDISSSYWKVKAKEALDYRNHSLAKISPTLSEITMESKSQYVRASISENTPENALIRLTPEAIARSIAEGKLDSGIITKALLLRSGIAAKLTNCVTEILPSRALERAQALDKHITLNPGKPIGPLHGLPISIKGSIAIKGLHMHTGWVSWWDKDPPEEDALIVEILENAGAVIHARTTVPQGMMQLEMHSNLFGTTTNPYNSELSAGGSSGGEAALMALGGSVLGVGSDIGGSIRVPAAACGVYGLKPTAFRIPANGWNCVSPSADTIPTVIGPISVSLGGIEMFMSTVLEAKPWIRDPSLSAIPWQSDLSLEPTPEDSLCIGILWHDDQCLPHPPIIRAICELVASVKADPDLSKRIHFYDFPAYKHDYAWSLLSKLYFSDGGASDIATAAKSGEPLSPLLSWLISQPNVKKLNRSQLELALEDREAYREEYAHHWNSVGTDEGEARQEDDGTLPAFKPYGCEVDVLISPVAPYVASPHGKAKYWSYTSLWNLLDYPALSVPTPTNVDERLDTKSDRKAFMSAIDEEMWEWYDPKLYDKMSVSLQLIGRRQQDEKVIAIAKSLEANHLIGSSK